MKVLILGGYGVFGGLLARLLLKDGVEVTVAGRDLAKAKTFTKTYGGTPLAVDISGDLSPIANAGPALVVDAVGPFQSYGDDPYRVPRLCIEHRINYLDFSDDADFTVGVSGLNEAAVRVGCFVLSGVSTVPAISAAAVQALSGEFSQINMIETALAPGNRAPRGQSVLASILAQAGEPLRVWRGGEWRQYRGWSEAKTVSLGSRLRRSVSLIGAPDLKLFPQAFGARSVIFRAGLELGVMHDGLTILGALRSRRLLPPLTAVQRPIFWASLALKAFGSDKGGMSVAVTGIRDGKATRRTWQVIASKGDGPFIPAVPARAVVRKIAAINPGARPCMFDLDLKEIESAMSGLSVECTTASSSAPTLFESALNEKWAGLPSSIRRLHSVQDIESFCGMAKVTRGASIIARCAALFFKFPNAGDAVPVTVTKTATAKGESWERNFGGRIFRSHFSPSPRPFHVRERFFAFTFEQELPVQDESLSFPVRRGWAFGLPLPAFLLPKSEAREYDSGGLFHFDVALYAPLTGSFIVRYQGYLKPMAVDIAWAIS